MKKIILLVITGLFTVAVLLVFFRPKQIITIENVKAKYSLPSSHFINWRGAELHYTDEGSGFPLVMVHGFGGSHRNFNMIAELLKNDFRVIRLDLPGFGMSDMPKSEKVADIYRDYMTFMIDTLQLDSFYMMGNSMGGWVTWQTAIEQPEKVKKIILLGSAGYDMEEVKAKAVSWLRVPFVATAMERGMPMMASEDAAVRCWADDKCINPVEVQANNDFWNREGNIQAAFAVASSDEVPDTSVISKITCPTLIIWGDEDEIVPVTHAEKFHRDIKNSELIIYPHCGHLPQVEKAEQLEKDFLKFCGIRKELTIKN